MDIERTLIKLSQGYDYEETKVEATKSGKVLKVIKTKKHVPPSLKAIEQLQLLQSRKSQKGREEGDAKKKEP